MSPRVVSLLASATEIVCALGKRDLLVGRSHECDYPPEVRALPRCSDPSFAVEGTSAEVDRAVKHAAKDALSIYRVDEHRLRELKPDLILTQTQCEVCAVSLKDVELVLSAELRRECKVLAVSPNRFLDVCDDILRIGEAIGARHEAVDLVTTMRSRLAGLSARVSLLPKPSIAVLEWLDPLMAAGHWIPELVEAAGGRDAFGAAGKKGPWLSFDQLRAADPDVLLAAPCGFPIARTRPEFSGLLARPEWRDLRAVREGRVFVGDGNEFFSRPGPRLVETAEMLAEMLHPDEVSFGHENRGWRRVAL
jgi:iron complex transport system substrate-binding protein